MYFALNAVEKVLMPVNPTFGTFLIAESKADSMFMWEYDIISSRKINLLDSVGTVLKYAYAEIDLEYDSNYYVNILTNNIMKDEKNWWRFRHGFEDQQHKIESTGVRRYKICKDFVNKFPTDTIKIYMIKATEDMRL